MAGPFDYTIDIKSPFENIAQGYQLGAGMLQARQAQEDRALALQQRQAEMERQKILNERISGIINNPNPTARDFTNLAMLLPAEQAKSVRENWQTLNEDNQEQSIAFGTQVLSAFNSDAPQVGIDMLRTRAEAMRNSGDEEQAKAYESWASIAEQNPKVAAVTIGTMLAAVPGGDKALESVFKAQKQPAEVMKAEAEAIKAGEEAKAAPRTYEAAIKKAEADAKEADARIRKIDAEIKRLEQTGGLDPDKVFDMETKLRAEYFKNSAVFKDVRDAYQRVESSQDNAVGDLSLIFGYMKMLDPGSVVREGEFATAQNAAGVDERIRNLYNKAMSGERLSPGQRSAFKGQAKKLFGTAKSADDKVRSGLTRLAGSYGLRPENIFIESNDAVVPAAQNKPIVVDY